MRAEDNPSGTPVRLRLAGHQRYIRVARAVSSSLAAARGFDVEEIDDLRIAVDELCTALLALGNGCDITLEFSDDESEGDCVVVTGFAPTSVDGDAPQWRDADHDLARQLLDVVATEYSVSHEGGAVSFFLRQRRRSTS
ncbi:MAG TPA: hypothetical protein VG478_12085 [Acidimicrobiales bacterium]|nr:hypothetical protein [Acidimicrobiales bacterium]